MWLSFEAEDSPILRDLVVAHHISHRQFQYFGWLECIQTPTQPSRGNEKNAMFHTSTII
jgi:hypothetical protein